MSSTAFSMPRFMSIGLAPATTACRPSLKMASARTVAVVVPSPATSLVLLSDFLTMRAPMFSYWSSSSISLATVTPSLVTVGRAEDLLEDDVAALGPERDLDGAGQLGDAPAHGLAGFLVERDLLGGHSRFLSCRYVVLISKKPPQSSGNVSSRACLTLSRNPSWASSGSGITFLIL